jgi:hypothetical protein
MVEKAVHTPRATHMKANRSASLAAATLLALAGCTSVRTVTPPPGELLSEVASQPGECQVIATPAVLPSADLLVDSAAVSARIGEYIATLERPPHGHVLLSMSYDSAGLNYRREVIEHGIVDATADSIQRLVFAGLREVEGAELPWYLRLRVNLTHGQVGMRVGRSEYCPPVPRDASLESRLHTISSAGVRYREGRRERLLVVRLEVATGGQVIGSQVLRGPIMTTDQQRAIADHVRQYSFHPATIDGRAVRGYIDIPVVIGG